MRGVSKLVSTTSLAPILVVVKKYGNNKIALTFLQNVYKSLGVPSPYAKLTKNIMWEWLTKES
jgi:hypothetical protein